MATLKANTLNLCRSDAAIEPINALRGTCVVSICVGMQTSSVLAAIERHAMAAHAMSCSSCRAIALSFDHT